jgi:DNA polymerase-1
LLLLIDGNNVAWAGYYALERAMKPDSDERRLRVALLGVASMTLGAIARAGEPPGTAPSQPLTRVALCLDGGQSVARRELLPAYQTGREGDAKFIENEPTITAAIEEFCAVAETMLPVDVLQGDDTEADDLIAGLVHHNPDVDKRIVSTDRDFMQLIGPGTTIYAPVRKLVIDEGNFFDVAAPKTSSGTPVLFPRERFLDYRALCGDTSDNIPGVPGVGALSAAKLVAAAPVDEFFGKPAVVRAALGRKSDAVERAFAEGTAEAIVGRNRVLMDLRRPSACWERLDEYTTRGTWDRKRFEAWFEEEKIRAVEREPLFEQLARLGGEDVPMATPKLL